MVISKSSSWPVDTLVVAVSMVISKSSSKNQHQERPLEK
jgi:hypothetical protein